MKKLHHLQRPEVKDKALRMRKGNALKKKILKLNIISRYWNINVVNDVSLFTKPKEIGNVTISAPQREMTELKKVLKFRQKMNYIYSTQDSDGKRVKWVSVQIPA